MKLSRKMIAILPILYILFTISFAIADSSLFIRTYVRNTFSESVDVYPNLPSTIFNTQYQSNNSVYVSGTIDIYHNSSVLSFGIYYNERDYTTSIVKNVKTETAYNTTLYLYHTTYEIEINAIVSSTQFFLRISASSWIGAGIYDLRFDSMIQIFYGYVLEDDFYSRLPALITSSIPFMISLAYAERNSKLSILLTIGGCFVMCLVDWNYIVPSIMVAINLVYIIYKNGMKE